MKEGHEYFARQEEEISNKYMSANGDMQPGLLTVSDSVKKANAQKQAGNHWSQNPLVSWISEDGVGGGLKRLAIFGVIAYVGYRVFIKKK